jgi:hypothetical protein
MEILKQCHIRSKILPWEILILSDNARVEMPIIPMLHDNYKCNHRVTSTKVLLEKVS